MHDVEPPAHPPTGLGWTRCRAALAGRGMPEPPLPRALADSLVQRSRAVFATSAWDIPQAHRDCVDQWPTAPVPSRALVAMEGHGLESLAMRVVVATPELGLFLRLRVTTLPGPGVPTHERLNAMFALMRRILQKADEVHREGLWPHGQRLLLDLDEFRQTRWGWLEADASSQGRVVSDPRAILQVLMALDQLMPARDAVALA
jgi:hypothetical protein